MKRLSCIVPFCRRTIARDAICPGHSEWICGQHWRAIPRATRARLFKLRRIRRRLLTADLKSRAECLEAIQWMKCKIAAIELAVGITA